LKVDPNGLKPTVAQAKAAYEAFPPPRSVDKVLDALHKAGFTGMARSTLDRWKNKGWPEPKIRGRPPSEETVAATKEVAEKAADAEDAAELAAQTEDEAEARKIAVGAVAVLSEAALKESLVAQILLAKRIQRHADKLVRQSPKEAAKLIEALKSEAKNITVVMPSKPEESELRTVGGNVIEHDAGARPMTPLQRSIDEFRAQQLKVVR
jgi:hypothetical protein